MASRKRTLLKVIILGDSGCVPAAIPPALDAPTTSRHFSVFQDFILYQKMLQIEMDIILG